MPPISPPSRIRIHRLTNSHPQAIQYLSADYQPAVSQTEAGIAQLTKSLAAFDLTKAEKLQIVNLAPTEPVELYVVCHNILAL